MRYLLSIFLHSLTIFAEESYCLNKLSRRLWLPTICSRTTLPKLSKNPIFLWALFICLFEAHSTAQTFHPTSDYIKIEGEASDYVFYNYIELINDTEETLNLRWKRTADVSFPPSWDFAVVDPITLHPSDVDSANFALLPNDSIDIVQFLNINYFPNGFAGTGIVYLDVFNTDNPNDAYTLTFEGVVRNGMVDTTSMPMDTTDIPMDTTTTPTDTNNIDTLMSVLPSLAYDLPKVSCHRSTLHIQDEQGSIQQVYIVNELGQMVWETHHLDATTQHIFVLDHLAKGIYLVQCLGSKNELISVKKIVLW